MTRSSRNLLAAVLLASAAPAWADLTCDVYVDDGGSNTAPYDTTAKAANLLSTGVTQATAGTDVICVRWDHAEADSGLSITGGADMLNPQEVVSYDCTSCDETDDFYKKATAAQFGGDDWDSHVFSGSWHLRGVWLECSYSNVFGSSLGGVIFVDSTLDFNGPNATDAQFSIREYFQCINCTVKHTGATSTEGIKFPSTGSDATFWGGTWSGPWSSTGLIQAQNASSQSMSFYFYGVNMNGVSSGETLVDLSAGNADQYRTIVEWHNTTRPASMTVHDDGWTAQDRGWILLQGVDTSGASGIPRADFYDRGGHAITDTATYITAGSWEPGGTKASIEFSPNSVLDSGQRPLCSAWVGWNNDSTSSQTYTWDLTESFTSALTQGEFWVQMEYNDTANEFGGGWATSRVEGSATALTADSDTTWTSGLTRDAEVALTFTAGRTGALRWRFCLATYEAAKLVNVDPVPGVS